MLISSDVHFIANHFLTSQAVNPSGSSSMLLHELVVPENRSNFNSSESKGYLHSAEHIAQVIAEDLMRNLTSLTLALAILSNMLGASHGQGSPDYRTLPPAPPAPTAPRIPNPANSTTCTTYVVNYCGFGTFTTLQAAIDAVPVNNTSPVTIVVYAGMYTEKVVIPASKPYITIRGAGKDITIITYNDTANSTGRTRRSATVDIYASPFTARNITFQNSAPQAAPGEAGAQAVALRISGDKAAFYGCGFISSQDTLYDNSGRHYFKNCYIVGNIDVIWGNGQSLYEDCEIHSTATTTGCLTAQNRATASDSTGFSFVRGSITGTGSNILGRAYGNYSRVVFIGTYMEDIIQAVGWSEWTDYTGADRILDSTNSNLYYGEYGNTGPGANLTGRVSWAKQLSAAEVEEFMTISFIDGSTWLASES